MLSLPLSPLRSNSYYEIFLLDQHLVVRLIPNIWPTTHIQKVGRQ